MPVYSEHFHGVGCKRMEKPSRFQFGYHPSRWFKRGRSGARVYGIPENAGGWIHRVLRQRIWVRRDEVLDAGESFEGPRRTFYSFTYRTERDGTWVPAVRWDNWEGQDHADRYDETGLLKERVPWRDRPLPDVLKLVKMFR